MDKSSQHDLENLIRLFEGSDWKEIYIKTDSLELFISDNPDSRIENRLVQNKPQTSDPMERVEQSMGLEEPRIGATKKFEVPEGLLAIRAPNLGTFYRRPKPESAPYVDVGDEVVDSSDVCLIEVMKLFTPVKARTSGKVVDILVSDGDMVEFDQPLILIEPS